MFKPGDEVICVDERPGRIPLFTEGEDYIIQKVDYEAGIVYVRTDTGMDVWVDDDLFEKKE